MQSLRIIARTIKSLVKFNYINWCGLRRVVTIALSCTTQVGGRNGKRLLGISRRRWEGNIKMVVQEIKGYSKWLSGF